MLLFHIIYGRFDFIDLLLYFIRCSYKLLYDFYFFYHIVVREMQRGFYFLLEISLLKIIHFSLLLYSLVSFFFLIFQSINLIFILIFLILNLFDLCVNFLQMIMTSFPHLLHFVLISL